MNGAKKRKGVTLLITLSVIAVMLALVGILMGTLSSARAHAAHNSALLQADLLRNDVSRLLDRYLKGHPSKETLSTLYSTPLTLVSKEGDFTLTASCKPFYDRIPLKWLAGNREDPKQRRQVLLALDLFERITDEAQIKDPDLLLEMLRTTLSGRHERFGISDGFRRKQSLGIDRRSLQNLLEDYRFSADDPNVYRIEWERYFRLRSLGKETVGLDSDYVAPALVAYLYDLDSNVVKEDYIPGKLKDFLKTLGEDSQRYRWLFSPAPSKSAMDCRLNYSFREGQYNVSFLYVNRRIEDFDVQATP